MYDIERVTLSGHPTAIRRSLISMVFDRCGYGARKSCSQTNRKKLYKSKSPKQNKTIRITC